VTVKVTIGPLRIDVWLDPVTRQKVGQVNDLPEIRSAPLS